MTNICTIGEEGNMVFIRKDAVNPDILPIIYLLLFDISIRWGFPIYMFLHCQSKEFPDKTCSTG